MDHKREAISRKIVDTYIMPDLLTKSSVSCAIYQIVKKRFSGEKFLMSSFSNFSHNQFFCKNFVYT